MYNMTKDDYKNLPIEEQALLLTEQGEFICQNIDGYTVCKLYTLNHLLIEEFRELETNALRYIGIVEDKKRIDFYIENISISSDGNKLIDILRATMDKEFVLLECTDCGFHMFAEKQSGIYEQTCPECDLPKLRLIEE